MPIGDPPPTAPRQPIGSVGWECPRCGATYAPWMAQCTECKPPADSLRQRIAEAQPPVVLPVPYVQPVYPAPLFPAPQWPWPQDRIVWCDSSTYPATTYTLTLTPEARARLSAGASTDTAIFGPDQRASDDDDGAAGVPARA